MRQLSILILLILVCFNLGTLNASSAIKGGVHYSIPIDYSKLSEAELADKAKIHYYNAQNAPEKTLTEDITNALFLYSVLEKVNSTQIDYPIKQGILYDKLGKDRYAKGCFSRAIGISSNNPKAYFYFGEFYYKREMYRKALKYYNEAYKNGFSESYETLYQIGDIYEKLGDTRSALKYLNDAMQKSPNSELENKIKKINAKHATNNEFYTNTRIRG